MDNMHLKVMFFTRPDGQLCLMVAGKDDTGQRLAITAYPPKGSNIKEYIEGMVTAALEERKTRAAQKSANFK